MKLRPHRPREPELNLTPLIDVVFLLLIFFMVSTTFERESVVKVDLPTASDQGAAEERHELVITVDRQGKFYVNDQAVINTDPKTLMQVLVGAAGDDKTIPVVIKADAQAPHQAVITVMDAAGRVGLSHISFPTRLDRGE